MGTNYYIQPQPTACPCCGRSFHYKHIGKSSWGWCFSLHVYPDEGINTLLDFQHFWTGKIIEDDNGDVISEHEMLRIITDRRFPHHAPARHKVDGNHCIGHGEGTYDFIIGEFS